MVGDGKIQRKPRVKNDLRINYTDGSYSVENSEAKTFYNALGEIHRDNDEPAVIRKKWH